MYKLEELIPGEKIISLDKHVYAVIYDGHAVIQSLPAPSTTLPITFKDMASRFPSHVTHSTQEISTDVTQIHIAFDVYRENSTKSQTREKRTEKSGKAYSIYIHMKSGQLLRYQLNTGRSSWQLVKTSPIWQHPTLNI